MVLSQGQIKVVLNQAECEIVRFIAEGRRSENRKYGVKDLLVAKEDPLQRDIEGCGAEYAFAKVYNLYPPTDLRPRAGSPDFVIKGKTIDIKQSDYDNARLIVPPYKMDDAKVCDSYVLVTGKLPNYVLRGFAKKHQICNQKNLITLRSLVYALSIKELNPMPNYERSSICS